MTIGQFIGVTALVLYVLGLVWLLGSIVAGLIQMVRRGR